MLFRTKDVYVDIIENRDLNEIVEVYNTNENFLLSHINKKKITEQWMLKEIKSMKEVGFYSCKIVDILSGKVIGAIDFKIDEETYLSLLIIHNDYRSQGIGKIVYNAFEEYIKALKNKCIRIDVVTNYDNTVFDFWIKNGFIKFEEIELNWEGKILPAITLRKHL